MPIESDNANQTPPQTREEPARSVRHDAPNAAADKSGLHQPTAPSSDWQTVVTYSAESEVRRPIRLLQNIFGDFLAGRELAWRLFVRNLRGLYRQTLLGLFWAFLPPIANTAMWIFLKSAGVFETGDTQVNATVYILTGMILWQAFIEAFQMPLNAIQKNGNMLSKLNFPRESLLLVGLGEVLFDLVIRLLLLIPAFLIFGVPMHGSLLLAPLAVLTLVLFGTALGLLIMPVGSLYQDVSRFISMVTPFWMIVTPIIYVPLKTFPGTLLNWVNPASPLLLLARDWILLGTTDHLIFGLIFAVITVPALLLGLIVYRVSIPVLVERMNA
jgi:lipopolysaccharide transport system permease protein